MNKSNKTLAKTQGRGGRGSLKRREQENAQVARELSSPLSAEILETVTGLSSKGWTETAIQRQLGIVEKVWASRKKAQPELGAALRAGRQIDLGQCMHALRHAALDQNNEVRRDADGMPNRTCLTALMGFLKLAHHCRDHGNPAGGPAADGVKVQIINIPAPMTRDQYDATLRLPTVTVEHSTVAPNTDEDNDDA